MKATINGVTVEIERPTLQIEEVQQPGGGYKPVAQKWLPLRCSPRVELTEPTVVVEAGNGRFQSQWELHGAHWEGSHIHFDSCVRTII